MGFFAPSRRWINNFMDQRHFLRKPITSLKMASLYPSEIFALTILPTYWPNLDGNHVNFHRLLNHTSFTVYVHFMMVLAELQLSNWLHGIGHCLREAVNSVSQQNIDSLRSIWRCDIYGTWTSFSLSTQVLCCQDMYMHTHTHTHTHTHNFGARHPVCVDSITKSFFVYYTYSRTQLYFI